MEGNEINLFHLLISSAFDSLLEYTNESLNEKRLIPLSSAFDSLLEYTNESLNEKRLIPLSYGEFRKFIGTLLLSSVFNTSAEQSWNLMGCLTANKHMCRECFVQVLSNLRGYDVTRRIISSSNSRWIDQRNTLGHLHLLEKKIFERSIKFFFDSTYSCIVLDDEMIGSKANDV
jgi:hypothetical protein